MITATLKGRLQTKALTYAIGIITAVIFSLVWSPAIWTVFSIAIVIGILLEAFWGVAIEYQPGWLTIAFGAIEYFFIAAAAILMAIPVSLSQATFYYWITWILTQLFLIYILPVIYTDWADNGHELT